MDGSINKERDRRTLNRTIAVWQLLLFVSKTLKNWGDINACSSFLCTSLPRMPGCNKYVARTAGGAVETRAESRTNLQVKCYLLLSSFEKIATFREIFSIFRSVLTLIKIPHAILELPADRRTCRSQHEQFCRVQFRMRQEFMQHNDTETKTREKTI